MPAHQHGVGAVAVAGDRQRHRLGGGRLFGHQRDQLARGHLEVQLAAVRELQPTDLQVRPRGDLRAGLVHRRRGLQVDQALRGAVGPGEDPHHGGDEPNRLLEEDGHAHHRDQRADRHLPGQHAIPGGQQHQRQDHGHSERPDALDPARALGGDDARVGGGARGVAVLLGRPALPAPGLEHAQSGHDVGRAAARHTDGGLLRGAVAGDDPAGQGDQHQAQRDADQDDEPHQQVGPQQVDRDPHDADERGPAQGDLPEDQGGHVGVGRADRQHVARARVVHGPAPGERHPGGLHPQVVGLVLQGPVAQPGAEAIAQAQHGEQRDQPEDRPQHRPAVQRDDRAVDDHADRYGDQRLGDLPHRHEHQPGAHEARATADRPEQEPVRGRRDAGVLPARRCGC